MIPVVVTENLILRGHEARDFDDYAAFWAGPSAEPFGGPYSRKEAWDSFLSDAGHWVIRGFGQWMVELKEVGKAVGWVGFVHPDRYEETEIGWTIYPGYQRKSLAYEASLAARQYGAEEFGIKRPASYIETWNTRSVALAERLGATCEDTRDNGDGPFHIYRHPEVVK